MNTIDNGMGAGCKPNIDSELPASARYDILKAIDISRRDLEEERSTRHEAIRRLTLTTNN